MEELQYTKLGLKCGLEIHQQLEGKKLFSHSPTNIYETTSSYQVTRTLSFASGETGTVDAAALAESQKKKTFVYHGYHDTSLVEYDEQPPEEINEQALYTALQLCGLTKSKISDEIHIMRKTVVDGSNTSGFQRTCLVGSGGNVIVDGVTVGIPTVCLEEDSAKIIERSSSTDQYNLSRLGIPLIEISTSPVLTTPQLVQKTAAHIGMLLRSTGRVKRGLGTIRQDVNVSIKEGARVEIKGAQDLELLPTLVSYEALRQKNVVELSKKLVAIMKTHGRAFEQQPVNLTTIFSQTESPLIKKSLAQGAKIFGICVKGCAGIIGSEIQPGKRVGSDLSDYAKVHHGIGGIIHSDEDLAKYKFSSSEIDQVKKSLSVESTDAFIMIAHSSDAALFSVQERLLLLSKGVSSEVRRANDDGTTSYMRPMSGAARMYPETDLWPFTPSTSVELPELIDAKIVRYEAEFGLSHDLAEHVARGDQFLFFEKMVLQFNGLKPSLIAETIGSLPVTLRRKYNIQHDVSDDIFVSLFEALSLGKISVSHFAEIVVEFFKSGSGGSLSRSIEKFSLMDAGAVEKLVLSVVGDLGKDASRGKIMGEIMKRSSGKADGRLVQEILDKQLS